MTSDVPESDIEVLRDARRLYQTYKNAAAKPSKVVNLEKLWRALESIREEGSRDYSLAELGRRLEKVGGPKTQSLRNAQGLDYRKLIHAYAHAMSGSSRYVGKNQSSVEQALSLIPDPSVRAVLRVSLDELKRLKVVNDNLHAAFKNVQIGATLPTPEQLLPLPKPVTAGPDDAPTSVLRPQFIAALKKGIDETRLAQQGLRVCEDGSVENEHGHKLFPPSFITALRAVIANH